MTLQPGLLLGAQVTIGSAGRVMSRAWRVTGPVKNRGHESNELAGAGEERKGCDLPSSRKGCVSGHWPRSKLSFSLLLVTKQRGPTFTLIHSFSKYLQSIWIF